MACDNFLFFGDYDAASSKGTLQPAKALGIGDLKVQGESLDTDHVDATEIKEFSFGVENPTTIGSMSGGAGAGKAKFNEFNVKKNIDRASAILFLACGMGCHFPTVSLTIRKSGGTKLNYLNFKFAMVFVTKIDWSGGGGEEAPDEDVTFVYGALQINYIRQDKNGQAMTPDTPVAWSIITNQPKFEVST